MKCFALVSVLTLSIMSFNSFGQSLSDFEVYDGMMRSEFVKLPMKEQTRMVQKMTGAQVSRLWDYKFQVVMNDDRLSQEEKEEYKKLISAYKAVNEAKSDASDFDSFSAEWSHRMITDFGWSDDKLLYYAWTFLTEEELRNAKGTSGVADNPFNTSAGADWYAAEKWAKDSLGYYSTKDHYDEFVKLPLYRQNKLYMLFPPEMKAYLWKVKNDDIHNSTALSSEEKKIVLSLYEKAKPIDRPSEMDGTLSEDLAKYKTAESHAEDILRDKFGWDRKKFFAYCSIWLTENQFREYCRLYNLPSPV